MQKAAGNSAILALLFAFMLPSPSPADHASMPLGSVKWHCTTANETRNALNATNGHWLWQLEAIGAGSVYFVTRGRNRRCGVAFAALSDQQPVMHGYFGEPIFRHDSDGRKQIDSASENLVSNCFKNSDDTPDEDCLNEVAERIAAKSITVLFRGPTKDQLNEVFCAPFGCFDQDGRIGK